MDPPEPIRILIAADHVPTRVGLRLALEHDAVCTEAADSESAVAAAVRDRPDVCLLDFDAPGRGLRAVTEIVARVPGVLCIVLTSRVEEEEFLAAMRDQDWSTVWVQAVSGRTQMLTVWGRLSERTEAADRWVRKAGAEHDGQHLPRLRDWVAELQAGA